MDRFAFDKNNIFTDLAGESLAGKSLYDQYENLIQLLDEIGNLIEVKEHVSSIPYCGRTGERIQPLLSTQWFMDVVEAAEKAQTSLHDEKVAVHPERFIKIFDNWL